MPEPLLLKLSPGIAKVVVKIFKAGEPVRVLNSGLGTKASRPSKAPARSCARADATYGSVSVSLDETGPSESAGPVEQQIWPNKIAEPGARRT